ncbi:cold-shock protein, putative [Plasmodium sp. gorilla clade G2]|uniref:cold-shock protein, putative n=1 Tax=Plasmodium sp. gorilla clade G2 TaxID=880535 RepID=UPI000D2092B1|nr:cold-shock protein, putative [Plasmodium sp. gorilla clade G2]SOV10248.1 cold-shock protein, putative [Plasmodium sp. gorilla clade G2]
MLRGKIHIHFNGYKKYFFSQLINKKKYDKITGNVIMFDKRKGYGFIKPNDGGPDIFVHYTDICQSRTFEVTNEEKKKLAWNASMEDIKQKKEEYNFEHDNKNNKKKEIKKEFKYLVPGERVKFSVIYDEKSNSSKAINVDYID